MLEKSKIILFEGPDQSGKSTIAKALSTLIDIPYYKNSMERNQKRRGQTKLMTEFAVPYLFNFLEQVPSACIMDRNYPSEFCYGQVEERDIDLDQIRLLDDWFTEFFDSCIIVCYKTQYPDFHDETTPVHHLDALVQKYQEFVRWTHCPRVLLLDTTSGDQEQQLKTILEFLDEVRVLV
jgi:thymidylate kinase